MVTMPPEVVRILASSTVLVKASSLVKRDLGAIVRLCSRGRAGQQLEIVGEQCCQDEILKSPANRLAMRTDSSSWVERLSCVAEPAVERCVWGKVRRVGS